MDEIGDVGNYFEQGGSSNYHHSPGDYVGGRGRRQGSGGNNRGGNGNPSSQQYSRRSGASNNYSAQDNRQSGGNGQRETYGSRGAQDRRYSSKGLFEQDQIEQRQGWRLPPGQNRTKLVFHYNGPTRLPQWPYERVRHLQRRGESFGDFRERMSVTMDTSQWRHPRAQPMRQTRRMPVQSPGYKAFQQMLGRGVREEVRQELREETPEAGAPRAETVEGAKESV